MSKLFYVHKNFQPKTLAIIYKAEEICAEYAAQGFDLTLRQLYYQFVARDLIPNKQSEYNRLGSIINDARLAGLLDWDYIVDRTRKLERDPNWRDPADRIQHAAKVYRRDLWENQPVRVEVWIEKDALTGVIEPTCRTLGVPYFSCRGYSSQSEMWSASQRLKSYIDKDQKAIILHLGDHDPSGIDMSRDIQDRLDTFVNGDWARDLIRQFEADGGDSDDIEGKRALARERRGSINYVDVRRIALTMDQVEEYQPPPNPAKATDARFEGYAAIHGDESWELDALDPTTLASLIRQHVEDVMDAEQFDADVAQEEEERRLLTRAADRWDDVAEMVGAEGA